MAKNNCVQTSEIIHIHGKRNGLERPSVTISPLHHLAAFGPRLFIVVVGASSSLMTTLLEAHADLLKQRGVLMRM